MDVITDRYALYHGDCIDVMGHLLDDSVDLSIYSPPFAGLYQYSSDERDLSNTHGVEPFFEHYGYLLDQMTRCTAPGRVSAVHCADIPLSNSGRGETLVDLPGKIIEAHQARGWAYAARYTVWKEPLMVRNRTMAKALAHQMVVEDSIRCGVAGADSLLMFRAPGVNKVPVSHPRGLKVYAGDRPMPGDAAVFEGWDGPQIENKFSHWIWRQYASCVWDDIRPDRTLPYRAARDADDERHVHPLQLDVVDRAVVLWSNPGETVLTPFMGVGSEVFGAVSAGRRGIGVELKDSYYHQAVKNIESIGTTSTDQPALLAMGDPATAE